MTATRSIFMSGHLTFTFLNSGSIIQVFQIFIIYHFEEILASFLDVIYSTYVQNDRNSTVMVKIDFFVAIIQL